MKKSGKKPGDASSPSAVGVGLPISDSPVSHAVSGVGGPGAVLARDGIAMNGNLYPGASSVWESMIPLLTKELSPAGQYNIVTAETSKLSDTMKQSSTGGGGGGLSGTMQPSSTVTGHGGGHGPTSPPDTSGNSSRIGTGDGKAAAGQSQRVGGGGKKKAPYIPTPPVCRPEAPIADEIEMMMLRDRVLRPTPPAITSSPSYSHNVDGDQSAHNSRQHSGQRVGSLSMPRSNNTTSGDYSRSLSPGQFDASATAVFSSPQPPKGLRGAHHLSPSQEPTSNNNNNTTSAGGAARGSGNDNSKTVEGVLDPPSSLPYQEFTPAQEGAFNGESMTQGVFVVNTVALDNVQRTGIPLPGAGTTNSKLQKNPALAVSQGPATNPKKRKGPSSKKKKSAEVVGFAGVSLPSAPAPPSDLPVVFPHPVVVGSVSYVNPKYSAPIGGGAQSAASPGRQGGGGGGGGGDPSEPLPFRTAPIPVTSSDVANPDQMGPTSSPSDPQGGGGTTPASSYFYGYSRPYAIPSGPHTSSLPVPIPIAGSNASPNNNGGGSPASAGSSNLNRTANNMGSRGGVGGVSGQAMMTVPGVMLHMKDPTQPMLISESNCQQRTELMNRLRGTTATTTDDTRPMSSAVGGGGKRDTHSRGSASSKPSPPLSPMAPVSPTSTFGAYTLPNRPPPATSTSSSQGASNSNKDRLQPRPPKRDEGGVSSNEQGLSSAQSISSPGRNIKWTSSEGKESMGESAQKLTDLKDFLLTTEYAALEAPRAMDRYNTALSQYNETQRVLVEAVQDHHDEAALLLHERARNESEKAVLQSRILLLRGTLRLMDVDHHRRHEKQKLDHGIEIDKLREELEALEDDSERTQALLKDKRETLAATAEADTSLIRLTRQYELDEKHLTSQLAEERERLAQTMSGKLKRTFTEMAALASRQQGDREVRAAQEASRLAEELREIERSSGELNQRMSSLKTTLASCDRNISLEKQRYEMLRVKNIKLAKQVGSAVDELRNLEGLYLSTTINSNFPPPTTGPLPPPSPRGVKNGSYIARTMTNSGSMKPPHGKHNNSAPSSKSAHFVAPLSTLGGNASVTTINNTKNAIAEARELAREVDDERRVVKGLREHNELILRQMDTVQLEVRGARAALVQRIAYADAPITSSHIIAVLQELELFNSTTTTKTTTNNNNNISTGADAEGPRAASSTSTHNTAITTNNDPDLESLVNINSTGGNATTASATMKMVGSGTVVGGSGGPPSRVLSSSCSSREDFLRSDRYAKALLPIAAIAQSAVEELSAHYLETIAMQHKLQEARPFRREGGGGGGGGDKRLQTSGGGEEESVTPLMLAAAAGSVSMLSIASVSGVGGPGGPWGARQTSASSGGILKGSQANNSPSRHGAGLDSAPPSIQLTSVDNPRSGDMGSGFKQNSISSHGSGGKQPQQYGREIAMLCEHADPHEKRMIQDYVVSRINNRLSAFHPLANVLGGGGSRLTTGLTPSSTGNVTPNDVVTTPNELVLA